MTQDVQELVRRAFDDIIDAAGDLGPYPSSNEEMLQLRTSRSPSGRRRSRSAALPFAGEPQRWVAVAAGLLAVLGMGAVLWAAQRPDGASKPIAGNPATPSYLGTDLDLSLPVVGRGWAESMDFTLSRDTNERLYTVWQTDIAACMKSRGFQSYQPVPYPANSSYEDLVNPLDRRYAAVMGYHELPAEPVDPNAHSDASRTQAQDCANAAYETTFGRISAYTSANDQLRQALSAAIEGFAKSDTGRAVTAEWASCMAARGHDFESRSDAILTFQERPTISADEITTRLDDLECDTTVSYTQTQHDWEQSKVTSWRDANSETIATAIEQKRVVDEQLAEIEAFQRAAGN